MAASKDSNLVLALVVEHNRQIVHGPQRVWMLLAKQPMAGDPISPLIGAKQFP